MAKTRTARNRLQLAVEKSVNHIVGNAPFALGNSGKYDAAPSKLTLAAEVYRHRNAEHPLGSRLRREALAGAFPATR